MAKTICAFFLIIKLCFLRLRSPCRQSCAVFRSAVAIGVFYGQVAGLLVLLAGGDCYRQRLNIEVKLIVIAVFVEHIAHHQAVTVIVIVIRNELAVIPKGVEKRIGHAAVFQVIIAAKGLVT